MAGKEPQTPSSSGVIDMFCVYKNKSHKYTPHTYTHTPHKNIHNERNKHTDFHFHIYHQQESLYKYYYWNEITQKFA